eukprot:1140072-Pelagomonas_calceolata.AAC.3
MKIVSTRTLSGCRKCQIPKKILAGFWERANEAGGSFEVDRMFLIVESACAVLKHRAFHSGWDAEYVPEGIANALICMW